MVGDTVTKAFGVLVSRELPGFEHKVNVVPGPETRDEKVDSFKLSSLVK